MENRFVARVLVDLTPLKKGVVECQADIQLDTMEVPEQMHLTIGDLPAEAMNTLLQGEIQIGTLFGNPKVSGNVEGGVPFETNGEFVKGISFGQNEVHVECYLGGFRSCLPAENANGSQWVFRLANLRLAIGDIFTGSPPLSIKVDDKAKVEYKGLIAEWHRQFEDREITREELDRKYAEFRVLRGQHRRNRVTFQFAGRRWYLDDDLLGRWPKQLNKISEPIASGSLSTELRQDDSEATLQEVATDICDLLSFALGRDVKWVLLSSSNAEGHLVPILYRRPGLLPFNQNGFAVIDNWEIGNVTQFLHAAETVYTTDRNWWSVTIDLLTQARGAKCLEVKCSLLNTLLDRISTKLIGNTGEPQIDPLLDQRIDRKWFRFLLHQLLRTLSRNWERHRTDSLCDNTIKEWNAVPSFPEKVIRSCDSLGIQAPSRTKLGFRHKLIHAGELDKKLKTPEKRIEYLFSIEAVVDLLMVRMLGFKGHIYLKSYGPNHLPVENVLAAQEG